MKRLMKRLVAKLETLRNCQNICANVTLLYVVTFNMIFYRVKHETTATESTDNVVQLESASATQARALCYYGNAVVMAATRLRKRQTLRLFTNVTNLTAVGTNVLCVFQDLYSRPSTWSGATCCQESTFPRRSGKDTSCQVPNAHPLFRAGPNSLSRCWGIPHFPGARAAPLVPQPPPLPWRRTLDGDASVEGQRPVALVPLRHHRRPLSPA